MNKKAALSPDVLTAFESVPDRYLILSPELVVLTASQAYVDATHTDRHQLIDYPLVSGFPPAHPLANTRTNQALQDSLRQVLSTKKPHQLSIPRAPRPEQLGDQEGSTHWLLLNTPVLDKAGDIHYIIHKLAEGTEPLSRQQSESLQEGMRPTQAEEAQQKLLRGKEELAQQAVQRYRELFQSIDQGFCTITVKYDEADRPIDYQFNEVSPSFEHQTGIKEGAGRWMRDIAADQDQFWFDVYGRVAKDRKSERFDYFSTPLARWWTVYAFPIDSADQRRIGVLFNDITARKKAETQQAYLLRLSDGIRGLADARQIQQTALRILGEHLQVDRVFYAEVDPDDAHFVVDVNYVKDNVSPMIGRFLLSDFGQTLATQRQPYFMPDIHQAGELAQYLETYLAYGIVSTMAIPLLKGGRWVATLGVHDGRPRQWADLDVTLVEQTAERTWAALERARAEIALSEANRRKDEFLALLAHELRNPLATLSNALLLLETSHGADEQLPLEMLSSMMSREVAHLVRLVDDLLDISRISRGTLTLRRQHLDLTALVQQAVAAVRPTVESARLQLEVKVPAHPVMVEGDADRLTQVLRNLLGNAIKFTPIGGQVELVLETVGQEALVRVTDTGIGLASSDLTYIFTMFAQVDGSRTRAQGGLGLGLTLVQDIIRLHSGRVEARSQGLGQGSEFIIYIPLTATSDR